MGRSSQRKEPVHDINRTELHAATPIVCPPDRCSGIAPNHAKMAEMLEMLPALLRQDFLSNIVVLFEDSIVQIRTKSIAHIIRRLEEKSEPYDSSRLQELSDFIADEMHSFCSGVVLSSIGNSIAFNALRGVFKNIWDIHSYMTQRSAAPCLCDLSHHVASLHMCLSNDHTEAEKQDRIGFVEMLEPPISLAGVVAELDEGTRKTWWANASPQEVSKLQSFLALFETAINIALLREYDLRSFCTLWETRYLPAIAPTRILEEMWNATEEQAMVDAFENVSRPLASTCLLQRPGGMRLRGDELAREGEPQAAIEFYTRAIMYDVHDATARTNCAAMRLQLANNSDQSFQWSRAVYDCTIALHYGPPTFKAHYRRGVALIHLEKWSEAAFDLKWALFLQEDDVAAQDQLDRLMRLKPKNHVISTSFLSPYSSFSS